MGAAALPAAGGKAAALEEIRTIQAQIAECERLQAEKRAREARIPSTSEPEPEPEQILAPQTSVVVSGLVSASQHNGKSGVVLRYQPKKGRYAVELESGEREAPPLLPEGMT